MSYEINGDYNRRTKSAADPRRIRSDPIGSDRVRSDPPTSPPERPPRRTQADSGGPKKSPPSPPESAADPIGSAINWRTVRQKKAAAVSAGKRLGMSPPIGGLSLPTGGLCPPREKSAKRTMRTSSAADKVRQFFPAEKVRGGLFP